MPPSTDASTNTSVDNAFAALTLFAGTAEPIGLTEMARALDLSLTTTHRIATALCDAEFLVQVYSGGPYEPGLRVRELLNAMYNRYPLRRRSTPVLRELADASGQAAVLYVCFGDHSLRIAGAQDRQQVHRPLLIGEALALESSTSGLVMLAFAGEHSGAGRIPGQLREQLDAIRRDGFLSLTVESVRTVAFPLLDARGEAFAVITVEGATVEFPKPTKRQLAKWASIVGSLQAQCDGDPELTSVPFRGAGTADLRLPTLKPEIS